MISVLFQTESHFPVKAAPIKEAVVSALKDRVTRETEVSVSIVGNRQMKKLNTMYRDKKSTTDVLSFPQHDPTQKSEHLFIESPDEVLRLGDIIVSYPEAVLAAAADNVLVLDKIKELVLHGLEHLMGNHHD